MAHYDKQDRGSQAAYEWYFAGMDSSMQQKVALTTAHFPVRGRIADMGSGSGRGTFDLASLYDGLELIGVDINPVSVQLSNEKFKRPNLSYIVGDISQMVFPENSLDGILDSSVLHHVTSFNDFDVKRVLHTFDNQVTQLKPGGVIIIRDFVIPDGPEAVYLDLPETDGASSGSYKEIFTAALFEIFAATWHSSVNPDRPVPFTRTRSPRNGFARFQLTLRAAAEFVLRKDYRADWDTEVLEEYTYLTQAQFEEAFRARGLRIVTSRPLWNPWIVQNRFEDKFYLSDLHNNSLPYPPTNYLIVGEKVGADEGVELSELKSTMLTTPQFLRLTASRHKESKKVYELVERPNRTIDVLPWFESEGQLFVLAKKDFPRPIVNACADQTRLAGAALSGYITEPLSAIADSSSTTDEVLRILSERAGLTSDEVIEIGQPFFYYTSPGAINELVTGCVVRIKEMPLFSAEFPNYTSFKSAGTVRELDALQVLRASHVGGMFDARLEINIYHLLERLGRSAGPWIGAPIKLSSQSVENLSATTFDRLMLDRHGVFENNSGAEANFLSIREGIFVERTNSGKGISTVSFEYVVPKELSFTSMAGLPVVKTEDSVLVGLELRDLPAVQSFTGSSKILTTPAWRLPRRVENQTQLPMFLANAMQRDFGLSILDTWELGGSYFCSPGVTPEVVYPFVVEVDSRNIASTSLTFVSLDDLRRNLRLIRDPHLLISAYRLIHALGC
ncbi:MAG TPA: class I SAM-dependent methyltransferase [Pyrinomonadaceae bacterium]|nr:class I SAM-dependent methyltransferase [Pyrinomonadaceae bacterium]